jgi:hypothetical protein
MRAGKSFGARCEVCQWLFYRAALAYVFRAERFLGGQVLWLFVFGVPPGLGAPCVLSVNLFEKPVMF